MAMVLVLKGTIDVSLAARLHVSTRHLEVEELRINLRIELFEVRIRWYDALLHS